MPIGKQLDKSLFPILEPGDLDIKIGNKLMDIADDLEKRKLYRFAEQVRAAGLSMSNNFAEDAGSFSEKEFAQFLYISRRLTFENANGHCVRNPMTHNRVHQIRLSRTWSRNDQQLHAHPSENNQFPLLLAPCS